MAIGVASPAMETYDAMAPTYDAFTADYEHHRWLARIVRLARRHGMRGRRAIDVGCGTGKSAEPLLELGFAVTACDVSPRMAAVATMRLAPRADVLVADMRDLPVSLGRFDLVTCLDDAVNYLTDVDDLHAAFASARRILAPDGRYVFDVNTLHAYATAFDRDFVAEVGDTLFCWHAEREADAPEQPDEPHVARLDAFTPRPDGTWSRHSSRHHQRHFSDEVIQEALEAAGLRCLDVVGQSPGAVFSRPADEQTHSKRLYVAGPAD